MFNKIITTLQNLFYNGERKNYTFDKFCTAHVEQHNLHAGLVEFGVTELSEKMKSHYFEEGIKDPLFAAVKSTILAKRADFQQFDQVMELYTNYHRANTKTDTSHQTRNISSVHGRGGGGRGGGGGRSRGHGRGDRKRGLVPQSEVDKVTIDPKWYPTDEYKTFTPAQKAKIWQTRKPDQEPGTGPTSATKRSSKISEFNSVLDSARSAISELTLASKTAASGQRDNAMETDSIDNGNNPALARQAGGTKKQRTGDK